RRTRHRGSEPEVGKARGRSPREASRNVERKRAPRAGAWLGGASARTTAPAAFSVGGLAAAKPALALPASRYPPPPASADASATCQPPKTSDRPRAGARHTVATTHKHH